jgi:hypothetical protein
MFPFEKKIHWCAAGIQVNQLEKRATPMVVHQAIMLRQTLNNGRYPTWQVFHTRPVLYITCACILYSILNVDFFAHGTCTFCIAHATLSNR